MLDRIGDALEEGTLVGPLHSQTSLDNFKNTIEEVIRVGGKIEFGGKVSR